MVSKDSGQSCVVVVIIRLEIACRNYRGSDCGWVSHAPAAAKAADVGDCVSLPAELTMDVSIVDTAHMTQALVTIHPVQSLSF